LELLDSPLMLNIAAVAYAEMSTSQLRLGGTIEERRDHLFGAYVTTMFRRRGSARRPTPAQSIHWLGWLAGQMIDHQQTAFYLERIQHDWLPRSHRTWPLRVCYCLVTALAFGFVGSVYEWAILLLAGSVEIIGHYWQSGREANITSRIAFTIPKISVWGVLTGCVVGLFGATFAASDATLTRDVNIAEKIRFSLIPVLSSSYSVFKTYILYATLIGFLLGTFAIGATVQAISGLAYGLFIGLMWGLGYGLVFGLLIFITGSLLLLSNGFSINEIETKSIPNQGIRLSARNALVSGLLTALSVTLVFAASFSTLRYIFTRSIVDLLSGLVDALFIGSFLGLISALAVGMKAGGLACLNHWAVRLLLICRGFTPWNYVKFLDIAADRILLRKVGGGYMFIHRMLLEHFAARYAESQPPSTKGSIPYRELD
jgi:hypothetical protein